MTDETPSVSALDRGFLLGDGVFDTMACFNHRPFALAVHKERLLRHAAAIGIDLTDAALEAVLAPVLADLPATAIVRMTVTRGVAARGLWPAAAPQPTVIASVQPLDPAMVGAPARLILGSIPRNERSPTARLKSLGYLDNILLAREAAEAGVDDALFLNTQGRVACSTIATVFAVAGHRLLTPPQADGAMDGTIRALLLAHPPAGLEVIETPLTPTNLHTADALFLTNAVRLVRPVLSLGETQFPPSPVTRRVLDHLVRAVIDACGSVSFPLHPVLSS